ncbi:MAG: GntR family transcriptional regulator [Spirochaetia bacterium]|nr:GntR family transcriptional regulator [Spirochaetia bacterium]
MSKADVVYDFLLDGIIKGVWLSGDRVNDKEIAEHLGVNRLAVREALSRLAQNDIIEQVQWKGYYIRNITEEDVQSLVQVRIALENLAMYLFLTKDDDVQQKYLKLIQKTIDDSIQFLKEGNHAKYMEIDFRFHELIYEASGNNMIAKVIGNTRLITSIMRNLSMGKEFEQAAMTSIQEHQNVFDALKAKDLEGAKKALYHHLANTFVTNIFKNIPHIY